MRIGYKTVRRIMKASTKRPITRSAINEMVDKINSLIQRSTVLADSILKEENSFRKIQGLRGNVRLNEEYIQLAFNKLLNKEEGDRANGK
jgi:hypothetical protein